MSSHIANKGPTLASGTVMIDPDNLRVATSGTVPRDDRCVQCGEPMLYRVDAGDKANPEATVVLESFCGNSGCPLFLLEIAE